MERKAEIERAALAAQVQDKVFEAMRVSDEDLELLEALFKRGDGFASCSPEEHAFLEQFSAEYEAAFNRVTGGNLDRMSPTKADRFYPHAGTRPER